MARSPLTRRSVNISLNPMVPVKPLSPRRRRPRAGRNESGFAEPRKGQYRNPVPIDELAASFAAIEGTAKSSAVFNEMTRILADKGRDQVLAYVATQGPGIPEKVKTRAAEAREKNRSDLLPLFKSAQLEANAINLPRPNACLRKSRAGAGVSRTALVLPGWA